MATSKSAPYKLAQAKARRGRAILTLPPSAPNEAAMIGRDVYVAGVNQYGKAAGWVRKNPAPQ